MRTMKSVSNDRRWMRDLRDRPNPKPRFFRELVAGQYEIIGSKNRMFEMDGYIRVGYDLAHSYAYGHILEGVNRYPTPIKLSRLKGIKEEDLKKWIANDHKEGG